MNTLTYNRYIGSVNFSEKDNIFFGKIVLLKVDANYL